MAKKQPPEKSIKVIAVYPNGMTQKEYSESLAEAHTERIAALLLQLCPEFFVTEEEQIEYETI